MVLPSQILGQNLQFPGKFAETFFLLFLGIFKNLAPSLKISFRREQRTFCVHGLLPIFVAPDC
jgi:hypothetical protein